MSKEDDLISAFGAKGHYADSIRAQAKSDDLKLFWVVNTAGSKQFVLATEPKFARCFATWSAHIRERENGRVFRASDKFFANNPGFGSSVKRATRGRTPGVIVRKGEHAVMGDRVYSPLHEV